jgi:hypothetical protein
MDVKRKIEPVVRKVSFEEAEELDDLFWMNATVDERLNELINLRIMVFGNSDYNTQIEKVVIKRSVYEEED